MGRRRWCAVLAACALAGLGAAPGRGARHSSPVPAPVAGDEPALIAGTCRLGSVLLVAPHVDPGRHRPKVRAVLRVDNGPPEPVRGPVRALPGLPPGSHTVELALEDIGGRPLTEAGTRCRFTVSLPAPRTVNPAPRLEAVTAQARPGGVTVRIAVEHFRFPGSPARRTPVLTGYLWAFADGRPAGVYATPRFRLALPPGPHQLTVGLYDTEDILAGPPAVVLRTLTVTVPGA
ncbi:exported protein of unknown function [Candidatus Hydrogenisulfobacillus filiaventi]|uniref:Uncharacterized protein n=1 Tax=Candidatus Hydrogenisulfobacillus filiaventi TaxID=2707344 RepID=A0A6F8ZJV8_9FIRM|nr:hypothetical protein [Bacillota bacterium]CAB1130078.1 exported protein of unknown function [Candidatus Hydrogenisulfobacillus filiaventi]